MIDRGTVNPSPSGFASSSLAAPIPSLKLPKFCAKKSKIKNLARHTHGTPRNDTSGLEKEKMTILFLVYSSIIRMLFFLLSKE